MCPLTRTLKLFTCEISTQSQIMATLGLGNFSDVLASIMIHTSHDVCDPLSTFLCIELAHPSSHLLRSYSSLAPAHLFYSSPTIYLVHYSPLMLLLSYKAIFLWSFCLFCLFFSCCYLAKLLIFIYFHFIWSLVLLFMIIKMC
jgi:hypothetical protein